MIDVFLGYPPPNIRAWIEEHAESRPRNLTYVTYNNGDVVSYDIVGTLKTDSSGASDSCCDSCCEDSVIIENVINVKSIEIGNTVTGIDYHAFYLCDSLTSVSIPGSVGTIGQWAFAQTPLSEIDIQEGVRNIGGHAFSGCGSVNITLPSSIGYIGISAFDYNNGRIFFRGKTETQIKLMENYPWGFN